MNICYESNTKSKHSCVMGSLLFLFIAEALSLKRECNLQLFDFDWRLPDFTLQLFDFQHDIVRNCYNYAIMGYHIVKKVRPCLLSANQAKRKSGR